MPLKINDLTVIAGSQIDPDNDLFEIHDATAGGSRQIPIQELIDAIMININSFPGQHIDGFSRVRTAEPGYRYDSQLTYQIDSDLWDQSTSGNATIAHSATNRKATLTAGATGSNTAVLQAHYHAPYTPGRSQLSFITFSVPSTPPTNGEVGVGYYDGENGVYLKRTSSGVSLHIETTTSAADQSVSQASWNIDPMDGTGPSGLTLDLTKCNILVIQLQALYVGEVVVGFDIGGNLIPVHSFANANNLSEPYIADASLPVRYWASTSSDASSAVIHAICASVISEGGDDLQEMPGRQFSVSSGITNAAADTVLAVVRPKSTLNSITNHALCIPQHVNVVVEDLGVWIELRRNMTGLAGTFENVNALSTAEVSYPGITGTAPTVTAGTGQLVDKFFIPASVQRDSQLQQGLLGKALLAYSHLLSTADNFVIQCKTGSTADIYTSLGWREIR